MILEPAKRIRFSMGSRDNCGALHFAIPDTAWQTMEHGLSQEFNLVLIGIPLMAAIALVRDREAGLSALRQHVLIRANSDAPHIRESEIVFGVGNADIPMLVLLVTKRGRKAIEAGRRHEFDLRPTGLPLRVHVAGFATHQEAQAHCMSVSAGQRIVDVSEEDLTIRPLTTPSTVRH